MSWEPGAFSFSFEKEFAIAYGPADLQVRELFPSTCSVWSSRDSVAKRESPTGHCGLSSVIPVLCRASFSRSSLAAAGSWTTFLAGCSSGHSGLHFPLVAGAPGRAGPAAGGTQGRAALHDPRCCIWAFSQVSLFIFMEPLQALNTKAAVIECEKLEEWGAGAEVCRGLTKLCLGPQCTAGCCGLLWDHAGIPWELCLGNCPQIDFWSVGPPAPEVLFEARTPELWFWLSRAPQTASTPLQRVME